jgi:hypothetical protein
LAREFSVNSRLQRKGPHINQSFQVAILGDRQLPR